MLLTLGSAAAAAADTADAPVPLLIGWATTDITPPEPVILVGQNYERIADPAEAYDRLTATAMAVSAADGTADKQAVLVSLDLVGAYFLGIELKERLAEPPYAGRAPGLDPERIVLFATHIHTGPYVNPKDGPPGTMQGDAYHTFLLDRLAELIIAAWGARQPGAVGFARAEAEVGFNRIAVYEDGHAEMYGDTAEPAFSHMEGPVDHAVELMYTWDGDGKLTGVLANVAAPAQVLEAKRYLSADYWAEVRKVMAGHPAFGDGVHLLPMCGAAGDQAPRNLEDHDATREDGWGHAGTEAIGRLLGSTLADALPAAEADRLATVVFRHVIRRFDLPRKEGLNGGPFPVVLHAVRLGDAAIVDVPFELYTEYGLDLKRRSAAEQTFIAELASGPEYGTYLPTEAAMPGGAYGSRLKNGKVGPEGGRLLVDRAVEAVDKLFSP